MTTNRMNGMTYDQAGNLTQLSPNTGEYDAENRLKKVMNGSTVIAESFYDGTGKRVKKTVGANSVVYIYDASGNLMAEDDPGLTKTGTQYLVADHLGSTRMVLGADGTCLHRIDYLPFGGESPRAEPCYGGDPPTNPSNVSLKFTGKKRDAETNLDYFGARYFNGTQGRFNSPDIPLIDQIPFDPQSWNLYGYVRNNPLMYIDPTGRTCVQAQTIDPDGRKHDTFADNGDGKGCEPAGIKPDSEGGLSASGQQFDINDQQGSLISQSMLDGVADFVAGAGDTLTFGLTKWVRQVTPGFDATNLCSEAYSVGEWTGVAMSIGIGSGAGFAKSGVKRAGTEFSHFIPNRMGGPRAWWNGNFVSPVRHYKHDSYRRLNRAAERAAGPKYPPGLAQLDRIPDAFKGAAAGGVYGGLNTAIGGCPAN